MLTKVYLEGPMGKRFGREWELSVNSPSEALKLIDVNAPGLFNWIRDNLATYSKYRVIAKYGDGRVEELDGDTFPLNRRMVWLRFVPLVEGAGAAGKIILGVVLIALSFVPGLAAITLPALMGGGTLGAAMFSLGMSMVIGGVIGLLTPMPKAQKNKDGKTSYTFDGPVNTTMQGVPIQLIYGKSVLVGSHTISGKLTVDQLMTDPST